MILNEIRIKRDIQGAAQDEAAVSKKIKQVRRDLDILLKDLAKLEGKVELVGNEAEEVLPGQAIQGFNLALGNLADAQAGLLRAKRNAR